MEAVVVCHFAVPDQHGVPACVRNPEAPGACPYGGPFPRFEVSQVSRRRGCSGP